MQSALKDTGFALRECGLLVPAIKALGKEHIDAAVVEKLRRWLDPKLRTRLLRDTRMVTGWIYEIIKQVCQESGPSTSYFHARKVGVGMMAAVTL